MKRRYLISITAVTTVLTAAFVMPPSVSALNAHYRNPNTLYTVVDIITEEEAASYTEKVYRQSDGTVKLRAGDCKITVGISANEGFANTGLRVRFDLPNYEPCSYFVENRGRMDEYPVSIRGPETMLGKHMGVNRFENDPDKDYGILTWGTIGTEDVTADGDIYSYFVRPHEGIAPEETLPVQGMDILQWLNIKQKELPYELINTGSYLRISALFGDADEDGMVDNVDAQRMLALATEFLTDEQNLSDYCSDECLSLNPEEKMYEVCWLQSVCDVDQNGKIEVTDAQEILNYYTDCVVAQNERTGAIGGAAFGYHFIAK
ncbi:MAG: hypothetical protein IK134_06705 [Oscillospiraceae bacterium]|nr:hypothetical protein [Oscillospiraceae bacterium]